MVFITGGAYQGKKNFAMKNYDLAESDIADGFESREKIISARCVNNFEHFVYRTLENGNDPEKETLKLLNSGKIEIIIMTETGCGIIPIEKSERLRREITGKVGCLIAQRAGKVIRLVCGIPYILK